MISTPDISALGLLILQANCDPDPAVRGVAVKLLEMNLPAALRAVARSAKEPA